MNASKWEAIAVQLTRMELETVNRTDTLQSLFDLHFITIPKFVGSDDPRTMSSDKCYGCYNSTIKVKCTGKLVRSQSGFFQDWWVNSKNCIKAGGFCCDGTKTSGNFLSDKIRVSHRRKRFLNFLPDNPAIFDPNDYPNADFCLNCYAGPVQNTTEMDGIWEKVVTSCSGQMIANNDYKASTCTRFGGSCCDDDTSTNSNFGKESNKQDEKKEKEHTKRQYPLLKLELINAISLYVR